MVRPSTTPVRDHLFMLIASTNWMAVAAIMSGAAAVGTLILAAVTVWLGASTRNMSTRTGELADETKRLADTTSQSVELAERELEVLSEQARATNAQVAISTQAMKAAQQPLIVPAVTKETINELQVMAHDGSEVTCRQIGMNGLCWQQPENGPIWLVIPVRNIGTGPALIPTDDNALVAHVPMFGGLTTFGRPGQRVIAQGDVSYLVFSAPYGATPDFTLARRPDEAESWGIVCVRYSGIDRSSLTRTRMAYRDFRPPRLLGAVVTFEFGAQE